MVRTDRGAVTVEAAIAVTALILVAVLGIAGVAVVADQVRCVDAAREAARLTARGEPDRARAAAATIAPAGADIDIRREGDTIAVTVEADPAVGLLPGLRARGEAYAIAEPGSLAATP